MAVAEGQRHDLHTYFQETMGRERANVMMELLPPVGWGDVATKQDLKHLRTELRADFAEVRGEIAGVQGEIAGVRAELREQIAEVRGEIAGVRAELREQIAEVRADLKGQIADLRAEFHSVMRSNLLAFMGANIALIGAGMGMGKLILG